MTTVTADDLARAAIAASKGMLDGVFAMSACACRRCSGERAFLALPVDRRTLLINAARLERLAFDPDPPLMCRSTAWRTT